MDTSTRHPIEYDREARAHVRAHNRARARKRRRERYRERRALMRGIREAERRKLPRGPFSTVYARTEKFGRGEVVFWSPTVDDPRDDEHFIDRGCPSVQDRATRGALAIWERFEQESYDPTILLLGDQHVPPPSDDIPW